MDVVFVLGSDLEGVWKGIRFVFFYYFLLFFNWFLDICFDLYCILELFDCFKWLVQYVYFCQVGCKYVLCVFVYLFFLSSQYNSVCFKV